MKSDVVVMGHRAIEEDRELQKLLERALESYGRILEMARRVQEPDALLSGELDWAGQEALLRDCAQAIGPVFVKAFLRVAARDRNPPPPVPAPEIPSEVARATPVVEAVEDEPGEPSEPPPDEAPPEEESSARPQPVQIDDDILLRLQQSFKNPVLSRSEPSHTQRGVDVSELLSELRQRIENLQERFSVPAGVDSAVLLEMLVQASSPSLMRELKATDEALQVLWLSFVGALGHCLQQRAPQRGPSVDRVFIELNRFRQSHITRFVHGLARHHEPQFGSWFSDAQRHGNALEAIIQRRLQKCSRTGMDPGSSQNKVEEVLDECDGGPDLRRRLGKLVAQGLSVDTRVLRLLASVEAELTTPELSSLRKRVRAQIAFDGLDTGASDKPQSLPDDWPFLPLTQGRRAVVVGSAGRDHQLESLQRAFGFESVECVDTSGGLRRLQSLVQSVEPGDERLLLVMHRYISHKAARRVWEKRGEVRVVGVDSGFGVEAVRRGIERHCKAWLDDQEVA